MNKLYGAAAGYALLASGCIGPQCLQDCEQRTRTIERDTRACYTLIERPLQAGSQEHARFNQHFKSAIEHTLGTAPYVDETFYRLDPDHFERHRDAILELASETRKLQPWILHADGITYERNEDRPPYRPYTQRTTPATLADIVRNTRAPRRKTVLGEIADTLHGWFGWLFAERPR